MAIHVVQGPFRLSAASGPLRPYFGVVPHGLLTRLPGIDGQAPQRWPEIAPRLDLALGEDMAPNGLEPYVTACREAGVLTWAQSAKTCLAVLASLGTNRAVRAVCNLPASPHWSDVECWYVKEGHTSSVWRVAITLTNRAAPLLLCVNVARDHDAGVELRASAQLLQRLRASDPDHVAAIWEIGSTIVPGTAVCAVTTLAEWVDGRELHAPASPRAASATEPGVVEIEWFLGHAPDGRARVAGRALSADELVELRRQYVAFLARHAVIGADDSVQVPALELNEGDIVWTGTRRLVVVAASSSPRTLSVSTFAALVQSGEAPWTRASGTPAASE